MRRSARRRGACKSGIKDVDFEKMRTHSKARDTDCLMYRDRDTTGTLLSTVPKIEPAATPGYADFFSSRTTKLEPDLDTDSGVRGGYSWDSNPRQSWFVACAGNHREYDSKT